MNKKKVIGVVCIIVLLIVIGILTFFLIPKIYINGKENEKVRIQTTYHEKGARATVVGKNISSKIKIEGHVDTNKPGKYKITYHVREGLFKRKVVRTVEVLDDIFPVIELKGSLKKSICPNTEYEEEGYVAIDNYDGDITNLVIIDKKDNLITYTVQDSSKNQTIATREIISKDDEKPVISIKGPKTKYVLNGSKYIDQGVSVSDNCDTEINNKVKKIGQVDTNKNGTYTIQYEVEDNSGNKQTAKRTVIVYDRSSGIQGVEHKGTIYLTFDDGPSTSITPKVLDILKEKNIKATFFVVNHSNDFYNLVKREFKEGHTIGLHSYTHNYKKIYSSSNNYFEDLKKISDKVKEVTGEETKIIRFPGGGSNTVSRGYSKGIMTYLTNEVINRGYHYFDWNVSSGDAGGAKNSKQVYNNVTKGLRKNRANIVLMHDFENNYKTLNALRDIIDYGIRNGYTFQAIDMTTPLVRHKVNN